MHFSNLNIGFCPLYYHCWMHIYNTRTILLSSVTCFTYINPLVGLTLIGAKFELVKTRWGGCEAGITLIKVTLSNLLVYYMSLLLMPVAVRNKLDHPRRDFLWLVAKRKCIISCNGLMSSNLRLLMVWVWRVWTLEYKNRALLAKWIWWSGEEKVVLWRKVIIAKYGVEEGGWVPSRVPSC